MCPRTADASAPKVSTIQHNYYTPTYNNYNYDWEQPLPLFTDHPGSTNPLPYASTQPAAAGQFYNFHFPDTMAGPPVLNSFGFVTPQSSGQLPDVTGPYEVHYEPHCRRQTPSVSTTSSSFSPHFLERNMRLKEFPLDILLEIFLEFTSDKIRSSATLAELVRPERRYQVDHTPMDLTPVLRLFKAHCQRWKALEISTSVSPTWKDIGVCEVPLLERLALAWGSHVFEDEDDWSPDPPRQKITIMAGTRLQQLRWGVFDDRSVRTLRIQWSALTEVHLMGDFDAHRGVEHVHLEDAMLCDIRNLAAAESGITESPARLAHIKTLTLDGVAAPVAHILGALIAPILATVALTVMDEEHLDACLRLLSEFLETLQIYNTQGIRRAPRFGFAVTARHLVLLTGEHLCLRLTHLTLDRCLTVADGLLARLMESRWCVSHESESTIARLCKIKIVFPGAYNLKDHIVDVKCAEELQKEGLEVSLSNYVPN
ncbi:hypothetical protein B0H14DRAFT_2601468 [Mycena olivaceomarginata]|nr:hypothetical protein B0H14DRAFT_2601468 [Mycena olivaceomarginata]